MKIDFSENMWNQDNIVYAYSYRFPGTPEFDQYPDHVENPKNPDDETWGYHNVSVLTRDTFTHGARITTECVFHDVSAPLIVISEDLTDECGEWKYGTYMEIVIWKNGVNVWRMVMDENKQVTWKLLMGIKVPFEENVRHTLSVQVLKDALEIDADELHATLRIPDMYESFHLGLDACEGICEFHSMTVEE